MAGSQRARTAELFAEALRLRGAEREAFLDRACNGNPALRADLDELLATEATAAGFLETSALGVSPLPIAWVARQQPGIASVLAPGDTLGRFHIARFMARGGQSEVYEAVDQDGASVALKVFVRAHASARERERFTREATIAAELDHPHLPRVLDFGEDPVRGLPYLAMRLVVGTSLAEVHESLARGGRVPVEVRSQLVRCFAEVAEALAVLHARGVMHRDVKPANILLAGPERAPPWERPAVLVDLGLARPVAAEPGLSTLWLTPSYAAPEVLLNEPVDQRADVYSLGLTMHDVLAGRLAQARLLRRTTRLERLGKLVPGMDPDLDAVVELCTASRPRWRYHDAGELAKDLRAWLARRPVSARRVRGVRGVWRTVRQHPEAVLRTGFRTVAAAAALLAVVLAAQWVAAVGSGARRAREVFAAHAFAELQPALDKVPSWLRPWLLPGELVAALPDHASDQPLTQVLATLRDEGHEAGLLLATRYLQRDGLAARPRLAAFLGHALGTVDGGTGRTRAWIVHHAARLFFERPDATAEDARHTEGVRRQLLELLCRSLQLRTRLDCLVALTGCATVHEVPVLLEQMEAAAQHRGPGVTEQLRLGLWALAAALRGSHRNGRAPDRGLAQDWALRVERLVDGLARVDKGCEQRLVDPLETFLCALLRACRAAGQEPPAIAGVPFATRRMVALEALLRPEAVRAVLHAGGILRGVITDQEPGRLSTDAWQLGRLAGCLEDGETERALSDCAAAWAVRFGHDAAKAHTLFQDGLRQEQDRRAGVDRLHAPDPRSLLATGLGSEPPDLEVLPHGATTAAEAGDLAAWSFLERPATVRGTALPPAVRRAAVEPDELAQGVHYLLLLSPGESELHLGFAVEPHPEETVRLQVSFQKSMRQLLPYDGECEIEVLLDGEPQVRGVRLQGSGNEVLRVPLCRASEPRQHLLVLRLAQRSETTLRIHSVVLTLK